MPVRGLVWRREERDKKKIKDMTNMRSALNHLKRLILAGLYYSVRKDDRRIATGRGIVRKLF